MSESSLLHHDRQKLDRAFVGGMAWTAGAKWVSQLVSWPSVLICARLLSQYDFGVVEMAGFYFIITNVVAEFGVGMAVLQMRELNAAIVAQLNSLAMAGGTLAFAASVLAAPWIAAFFHAPELHKLVIVASLTFILTSFEAIPLGLLQRDMDYRRLSLAESLQAIVTAVVSVACAFAGFAYWAILAGNLLGRASNIALVIWWRPVRFAVPVWRDVARPLSFGMEIAAQRIVGSFTGLSDSMIIGRTLGAAPLGTYRLASNLASTPSEKIGALIMRVTGPLFARVQGDNDLLRRYFLIFTETLALTTFPLLIGLAVVAPDAVRCLLSDKWASAAVPMSWLAIYMTIRTLSYLNSQLLTTLRFTRFGMWISILNFILMPVAFFVMSKGGIGAVAAAWLLLAPVSIVPITIRVLRETNCTFVAYLGSLMPAALGSLAMVLAVAALRHWWLPDNWVALLRLVIEVLVGGAAYAGILGTFYRERIMQYYRFFLEFRLSSKLAAA